MPNRKLPEHSIAHTPLASGHHIPTPLLAGHVVLVFSYKRMHDGCVLALESDLDTGQSEVIPSDTQRANLGAVK